MFRNSKTGFVVSGAVLILACYTNPHSARAQEFSDFRITSPNERPPVCEFEDDFIPEGGARSDLRVGQVLGDYPILVILVNFGDDPDCDCVEDCGTDDCFQPEEYVPGHPPGGSGEPDEVVTTAEQAYGIFFGDDIDPDYLSVSDYYDEASYGRMQLTGGEMDSIHAAAGYYTLDIDLCVPSEGGACSPSDGVWSEIRTQAIPAAEADGWDVHLEGGALVSNTYEGVVFAFPRYPGITYAGLYANGSVYVHSLSATGTSIHELGHMIGLGHANSMDCGDLVWDPDGTCSFREYGNLFDVMGYSVYGHFNAAIKQKLGWLDSDTQVLTLEDVSDDGTYYLRPLEVAGDDEEVDNYATALRMPRGEDYYYFEFRRRLGFDRLMYDYLTPYSPYFHEDGFDGLMANRLPSSWRYRTYLLDMTPDSIGPFPPLFETTVGHYLMALAVTGLLLGFWVMNRLSVLRY